MRRGRESCSSPRAFEELLSGQLDALYRTALRLCSGRAADAEDLLQDATLRAFERHGELRDPQAARSWLFTVLVRTHLNQERSRRRRRETLSGDMAHDDFEAALAAWTPMAAPDERLDLRELRERLTAALDELPSPLRTTVWLADVEGFTHREVATMLEVPEGTVASRLFRARRVLRDTLEDAGIARHNHGRAG